MSPFISRRGIMTAALAAAALPMVGARPADLSLRALAAQRGLLWGAAIGPETVDADPGFAALLRRQCAVLVPENAMKWDALQPLPDSFTFEGGDRVVELARDQAAVVHGHCLVWHQALPSWVLQTVNPGNAAAILTRHIGGIVNHYAGQVRSWDVVNESTEPNDHRPDSLRRSPWLEALGPGYIDLAFHTARDADPKARLALADYGVEYDSAPWMVAKRTIMLTMLRGMLARGVPVHALAIQGHLDAAQPPSFGEGLGTFLRQVSDLGLEIYITELDVSDQTIPGDSAARDQVVADVYYAFLDRVLREPSVKMINTWGLTDRHTSKTTMMPRADGQAVRPLPFDQDLQPKPAAYAIADALMHSGLRS